VKQQQQEANQEMIIKKPSKSRDNQNGPNVFFYKNQFFY